jgi:regulator of protease activity HflC (stomatin/prohibitin superfamily)
MITLVVVVVAALFLLMFLKSLAVSVPQASVAVVTSFGRYKRVMNPGLNFKLPFVEKIHSYVPVQNQTHQMQLDRKSVV